jgi:hypothetical protein
MSQDTEDDSKPYLVGNRRPPRDRQFKPGASGNPAGRRKGSLNFKTLLAKRIELDNQGAGGGKNQNNFQTARDD